MNLNINFKTIDNSDNKSILYNLLKAQIKGFKGLTRFKTTYILKSFWSLTMKQEDKKLYYRIKSQKYQKNPSQV